MCLSGRAGMFWSLHRGSRFLQIIVASLPDYTASQSKYNSVIADWSENIKLHVIDRDSMNSWHTE